MVLLADGPRGALLALLTAAGMVASGCAAGPASMDGPPQSASQQLADEGPADPSGEGESGDASDADEPQGAGTKTEPAPTPTPTPPPPPPSPDQLAGLLAPEVPPRGDGVLHAVPGAAPAPGQGAVRTVRIEVEGGLPVDAAVFADFVLTTLNDSRGWGSGGQLSFARTDGPAEIQVVLASPETSAQLCRPLVTYGKLSCRRGEQAIITHFRWVNGSQHYGGDITGYRQYVLNHEVGHVLGHGHVSCPGAGQVAPVMLQQTLGLQGCTPNPWPFR